MKVKIFIEWKFTRFWKYVVPHMYYESFNNERKWYYWLFWNIKINKENK